MTRRFPPLFISGPHGAGKTTLIERLKRRDNSYVEPEFDIDFLSQFPSFSSFSPWECSLVRLYHRIFLTQHAERLSRDRLDTRILVSRGVLDSVAYIRSYQALEWITGEQFSYLSTILNEVDEKSITVILNPSIDVICRRLSIRRARRQRTHRDQKFANEDTPKFVSLLWKQYEVMKERDNVLLLRNNEEGDCDLVVDWLEERALTFSAARLGDRTQ
jgi:predicted ATPase